MQVETSGISQRMNSGVPDDFRSFQGEVQQKKHC